MTTRFRIADLGAPDLNPTQVAALRHAETNPVTLTVDAVLDAAMFRTDLDDFGPEDFLERLCLWLDEVDQDPKRTAFGRASIYEDCVRNAENRLLIRDLLKRHPEIEQIQIARPIIVVGLPRSGTTNLVNMIAADSRLRSMPLWESYQPVPNPRNPSTDDGVDARITQVEAAWEQNKSLLPHRGVLHPMNATHVHEEIELQSPDFSTYRPEFAARSPRWRDYYLGHDQAPHYRYMRTVLKILQWYQPRDRWVLKSPQHLEQLGPLLDTFPDATVVVTHRDPVSVVQSTATMLAYGARMNYTSVDPEWYVAYWIDRIRRLLERSVRDQHLVDGPAAVHLMFHDLMADPMGALARVYDAAGLPLTDTARAEIGAYVDTHPRANVVYDLRRDFGAEPAAVRESFGFYFDAYPEVRIEVS